MLFSVMFAQLGWPGVVGATESVCPLTRNRSRFGPPLAVVAVARTVLVPALSDTETVRSAQVSQLAVAPKDRFNATELPFTVMSIGRSTVVPLAYRNESCAVPAAAALTENCTYDPATFV